MKISAKVVGQVSIPKDSLVHLDHVRLRNEDYSCRTLMGFGAIGSRLEQCRFDKAEIDCASFGAGREMSEYVECSFDGARMGMGPGGFARFVRCSFRNVRISNWLCFAVEVVDCVFSGRLRRAVFNGTVRAEDCALVGRIRNEFHGNDFSAMDLIDVGFRTGIDLTRQHLPSRPEYLYLPDVAAAVERARIGLANWLPDSETQRVALTFVKGLEEELQRGQRQMLLRADDYHTYSSLPREAVDKIFSLLGGKSE